MILQRCTSTGECEECKKKRIALKSAGKNRSTPITVPRIVHAVLGSPGQPLDSQTRAFMDPRFGHDFSQVRVHTDLQAAESAHAVNALAYTVGHDIVFGSGKYVPHAIEGVKLLAHELTHVVQQDGISSGSQGHLTVGKPDDAPERESKTVSESVVAGTQRRSIHSDRSTLRRNNAIDVDLVPSSPEETARLEKLGIHLPQVSESTWRAIGGTADYASKSLSANDKARIEALLIEAGMPTGTPLASVSGPTFILHDTSARISATAIAHQVDVGRGPLGTGVSAYVPESGIAIITRGSFFEARRPSTTEYEKATQQFEQPGDTSLKPVERVEVWKQRRDDLFRVVWNATQPSERAIGLDTALAGLGLTGKEIAEEKTGNKRDRKDPEFTAGVENELMAGSTEKVTTSASWAVDEICKKVTPTTLGSMAIKGKEKELSDACTTLAGYFRERNTRIASTVPIEIVQPGVRSKKGSQDTCNPNNPNIAPLADPPYSNDQYKNIVLLYLRAALIARIFPTITTHFAVDAFIQGHCDPRCFDLGKLYEQIALALHHGKGSTYGIKPSYGRRWGANTVWWNDKICHKSHP